ncbi:TolC family outer membrane protein [Gluconobacter albidus]|uniref:Channel protein TolC n=3 Tax=Gluconobacter albidus TaxID=318683 RepID=A0ABQ5X4M0_9PROT|nr:TolC family outer membrane protein [Gluconobacter albidus]MCP1272434.1 TolC family outer membrane protein [Gluconobacter albidus]GBQ84426.1 secretion system type I outer membrane protein TolC [Gluconobacter albidus NBRC 3250]GLQ70278.1 channel protein TolC [Gluconobacter albidus]
MTHRKALLLALLASVPALLPAPAEALTLQEALALAYRSNPTLRGEQANQRAVTENSAQARSGWRPTVQVNMDASYQQGPYTSAFALGSYTSNSAEGYLSAKQTLYSFGHVANQVRAADARSRAEQHQLRLVEAQVFTGVVTAYMNVLRDRNILDVRQADLDMLTRQVQLTTSRYNLGGQPSEQVTRTDVEQAETRRRSAEVAVTQAQATLAASVAQFRAVIGTEPDTLTMPDGLPGLPETLDQALRTALALNPQLIQMQETRKATAADIDTARSQWGPQIQVQGTFGTIGPASPFHGDQYGEQVTGLVQLVQPIYNGDLYNSQIRQARNRDEQARESVELARRTALQDVATNWHAVENGLQAIRAGTAEVRSGETSLKGYQIEYGYGLRSTTDVLYADQNLRSAQVELAGSRHDTIVAEATLLASMGRLQADDLLPNLPHYDAAAKLQRARTRGWEPLQAPISAIDKAGW